MYYVSNYDNEWRNINDVKHKIIETHTEILDEEGFVIDEVDIHTLDEFVSIFNSFSVVKIEHGTKIYNLTETELTNLQSEKCLTDKYNFNVKRYDDGSYSVYFQDKSKFHIVEVDGIKYKVYD